jgi:hypothetical protein
VLNRNLKMQKGDQIGNLELRFLSVVGIF